MTIELAGRPLRFLHTPGHAMHHHCIWDAASRGFFTGDTFGLSYRDFDTAAGAWIMPTTTPVQFQPEALRRSIERMLAFDPDWIYVTHYGRVGEVPRLAALLLGAARRDGRVRAHDAARAAIAMPTLMRGLEAIHLTSLRAHGVHAERRAHPRAARARPRAERTRHRDLARPGASPPVAQQARHERSALRFRRPRSPSSPAPRNGIGAACARLFAASGAAVALWDVDAAAAQALAAELASAGARAEAFACNVARSGRGRRRARRHARRVRPRRRPGQQRRHLSRRRLPRHRRGRLGRRHRRQPEGRVPGRPGGRARDGARPAAARSST